MSANAPGPTTLIAEPAAWWQDRALEATKGGTAVGRRWFDQYIGVLKRQEQPTELESLPFPQRFREVASMITFGEPFSPLSPGASRHEENDFLQALVAASERLKQLLAVRMWGADAFLPPR